MQSADVLAKLDAVPLLRWATTASAGNNPEAGEVQVTHLSPDLASFHAIYGLGVDGQSIAPLDVAAVALASAQALKATVDAQNAIIAAQESPDEFRAFRERVATAVPASKENFVSSDRHKLEANWFDYTRDLKREARRFVKSARKTLGAGSRSPAVT